MWIAIAQLLSDKEQRNRDHVELPRCFQSELISFWLFYFKRAKPRTGLESRIIQNNFLHKQIRRIYFPLLKSIPGNNERKILKLIAKDNNATGLNSILNYEYEKTNLRILAILEKK